MNNYEEMMLLPQGEESADGVVSYMVPALKSRKAMLRLAVRMDRADMLEAVDECRGRVSIRLMMLGITCTLDTRAGGQGVGDDIIA